MVDELRTVIVTPDGQQFETKAEAQKHIRKPQIIDALKCVVGDRLANWLFENEDVFADVFSVGTIRRVTKKHRKDLETALEAVKLIEDKNLNFIKENAADILNGFKWPTQPRMKPEEKAIAVKNALTAAGLVEDDIELVSKNQEEIEEAFKAGMVKRVVAPQAIAGLAAYRARKAAEKSGEVVTDVTEDIFTDVE
jgi:hypothetical protein